MAPRPRALAIQAIRRVEQGEFSNRALSQVLEAHPELDRSGRRLVTSLLYGVLRHRNRLDRLIDSFAHDAKGVRGKVRQLLRIGAYELVELEHPIHAVASEVSKVARDLDPSGKVDGLCHAVLAGIDRDGPVLDVVMMDGKAIDALELRWSIPRWLAGKWIKQLGEEAALRRGAALARVPPVELRINHRITDADTLSAGLAEESPDAKIERVEHEPYALRVRGGGDLFHGALHDEGAFSVQSVASQQPVRLLAPEPGERVLDACCGLGVKTLQIAEWMDGRGTLVSVDREPTRLDLGRDAAERGGLDGDSDLDYRVHEADLLDPDFRPDAELFDAVLLDAPCTGLGNLARHPEIRYQLGYDDIARQADLQAKLLARCAEFVRPGGRLVYSVCSLEPEEGPQVVAKAALPLELVSEATWTPETHDTDGFYVALLRRPSP